ncbi:MAG: hypothetical protein RL425_1812 [Pseudomonadota bacterium]
MRRSFGLIGLSFAFGLALSTTAGHAAGQLHALSSIETGLWDLRSTGGRDVGRSMCVTDPAVLLQLGHPGRVCSRFPIVNQPKQADVYYSCAGAGQGQTRVRVETPRLVQIETQGFLYQDPFSFSFEARRIGDCTRAKP